MYHIISESRIFQKMTFSTDSLAIGREDILVKEIMNKGVTVCYPDEDLRTAMQKLGERDIGRIPVVEKENPSHLIGLITRENIIAAYNEALVKSKESEYR